MRARSEWEIAPRHAERGSEIQDLDTAGRHFTRTRQCDTPVRRQILRTPSRSESGGSGAFHLQCAVARERTKWRLDAYHAVGPAPLSSLHAQRDRKADAGAAGH